MTALLKVAAFFILMECQIQFTEFQYSWLTAAGLMCLSLQQVFFSGSMGFKTETKQKNSSYQILLKGSNLIIAVYVLGLLSTVIFLRNFGHQFLFVLFITALSLTALSIYEYVRGRDKKEIKEISTKPNKMASFTIPIIFLYLINFLISVQLEKNLSFQFILILSCLVLYDVLHSGKKFAALLENHEIDDYEFHHYLFHRWSKYMNFFLGVWFFITLHANGIINQVEEAALIFVFCIIFFTFIYRMVAAFEIKDFIGIMFMAALLTSINPILDGIFWLDLPHYIRAVILFLFFDLWDIYMHSRQFKDANYNIWAQKTVIYILMTIFIVQLQMMGNNPTMSIDKVFSSVFQGQDSQTVDVSDTGNGYYIREASDLN